MEDTPQVCKMMLHGVGDGLLIYRGLEMFEMTGKSTLLELSMVHMVHVIFKSISSLV